MVWTARYILLFYFSLLYINTPSNHFTPKDLAIAMSSIERAENDWWQCTMDICSRTKIWGGGESKIGVSKFDEKYWWSKIGKLMVKLEDWWNITKHGINSVGWEIYKDYFKTHKSPWQFLRGRGELQRIQTNIISYVHVHIPELDLWNHKS